MAETTKGIYYNNDYEAVADILEDMKSMAESIDEVIDNNKYDDTDVKQNISSQSLRIAKVEAEQTTQNNNIQSNTNKLQQLEQKHKKEIEDLENLVPTRRVTRRRHYFKR